MPQDRPGADQEVLARRRQAHAARLAQEQGLANGLLQLLHLQAERRLGAADQLCRVGEAAAVGDRREGAQKVAFEPRRHGGL